MLRRLSVLSFWRGAAWLVGLFCVVALAHPMSA